MVQAKIWLRALLRIGCLLVFGSSCVKARAASLYTEPFSGSSDWSSSGDASASETQGECRAVFPNPFPLPLGNVNLLATNGASGGAFTGDFASAGVQLIGFRFKADDAIPNSLLIRLKAGTNDVQSPQLAPQIPQTGNWYDVWTVLDDGGWGRPGVVTGVTLLAVFIQQNGNRQETYHMDDFFTDSMPVAGRIESGAAGETLVSWTHLRPGWTYDVSRCDDPTAGGWSNVSAFSAGGAQQDVVVTNEISTRQFFRLE